LTKGVIPLFFP